MWRCRSSPASVVSVGSMVVMNLPKYAKPAGDAQHGGPGPGARRALQIGHQRFADTGWQVEEVTLPRPPQVHGAFHRRGHRAPRW